MMERAGFLRLCNECKGRTVPREEMTKATLDLFIEDASREIGKTVASLAFFFKDWVHVGICNARVGKNIRGAAA
jgi:hypothetical protein